MACHQAERALKAGDAAPGFTLADQEGQAFSSARLLAEGPLFLAFLWGNWCPLCDRDLEAMEQARPEMERRGASVVAVTPQTAENGRLWGYKQPLGFPVLSDPGGRLAAKFGLRWVVPDGLKDIFEAVGADLASINDDKVWRLPLPARYVIDRGGTVAYAETDADYARRPNPAGVLPVLDALNRNRPTF